MTDTTTTATGRAGLGALSADELASGVDAARGAVASGTLALLSVSGSWLYGLADPGRSDLDLRGVYVAATDALLGLDGPVDQYERSEPDLVVYELAKFARLALGGNANILEVLFSPRFAVLDDAGADLVAVRDACLSRQAVSKYLGYANSQHAAAGRIMAGTSNGAGRFSPRARAKHVRHTFRLLHHAHAMATTGRLDVVLPAAVADELDELCTLELAELSVELESRIVAVHDALEYSPLPETPDRDAMDAVVRAIRRRRLR